MNQPFCVSTSGWVTLFTKVSEAEQKLLLHIKSIFSERLRGHLLGWLLFPPLIFFQPLNLSSFVRILVLRWRNPKFRGITTVFEQAAVNAALSPGGCWILRLQYHIYHQWSCGLVRFCSNTCIRGKYNWWLWWLWVKLFITHCLLFRAAQTCLQPASWLAWAESCTGTIPTNILSHFVTGGLFQLRSLSLQIPQHLGWLLPPPTDSRLVEQHSCCPKLPWVLPLNSLHIKVFFIALSLWNVRDVHCFPNWALQ